MKFEALNSRFETNSSFPKGNVPNNQSGTSVWGLLFRTFRIVSCFGFRISNLLLALVLITLIIAGCGGGGGGGTTPDPGGTDSGISISISPLSVTLKGGEQVQFTPAVTGTTDHSVQWEVVETLDGGMIGLNGLYTAPSTVGTVHVKVTSLADTSKFDIAEVIITKGDDGSGGDGGIIISVTPQEVVLLPGETQQFYASIVGHSNQAVDWTVLEGSSGGNINSSGFYTAPAPIGTYHVKATSQADPTKTSTAIVNVVVLPPFPIPD